MNGEVTLESRIGLFPFLLVRAMVKKKQIQITGILAPGGSQTIGTSTGSDLQQTKFTLCFAHYLITTFYSSLVELVKLVIAEERNAILQITCQRFQVYSDMEFNSVEREWGR
ncbi:hypothetical protein Glove_134g245 [Diversispora epigaea]|uniref:Uncharacterized protein n=1 Tax=Diversispora epigaea TaxID=1348612 RepID=A0A397IX85_9GLOM|nr:hypothetical protein Glove_134g245 [Diversispora epigaea]